MSNTKNLKFVYAAILSFVLATLAFPADVPVGKQLSELISSGNYDIMVRSDDPQVRKIDIIVNLQNGTGLPTFNVKIETFQTDFSGPSVIDPSAAIVVDDPQENFMGDQVSVFRRGPSSIKRFVIRVKFHSYFNKNPMCQYNPGAEYPQTKKKVTITMGGLASGHLQAYVHAFTGVPVSNAAPCTSGADGYDVIESSELSFIKQDIDPAKPTDVILVLDISGSMNHPPATDLNGPDKIQVLHDAAQDFIYLWGTEAIPGDPLSAAILKPNDHVGAVFFQSMKIPHPDPNGTIQLVEFGPAVPSPDLLSLYAAVGSKSSLNGATAMGEALDMALNSFNNGSENYRYIVLFTNGMQNAGDLVVCPSSPTDALCTLKSFNLQDYGIPIYTVGTGVTTSSSWGELLKKISDQTGGKSWYTTEPALDLEVEFITALVDMHRENSPAIVGIESGVFTNGQSPITHTFQVNKASKNGIFFVTWHTLNPTTAQELEMEVYSPGTTTPITPGTDRHGNHHHIGGISFPISGGNPHEGTWTIKVLEKNMSGAKVYYHAGVIVDEAKMHYNVGAEPMDYGTGDPIVLTASIKVDEQGVTNADTVECTVTRPRNALGTFLNQRNPDAPFPPDPAALAQTDDRFPDLYAWKLHQLIEKQGLGNLLEPITDPNPVTLVHKGNGKYQARYTNTKLPGQYKFDFSIKGNHALIGKYEREETSIALVRVKTADPEKSEISCEPLPGGKKLVTVVPADKFENFLGPGYEKDVSVTSSPGTVSTVKDERVNGTYTATVSNLPPNSDPKLTVKVNGRPLVEDILCGETFKQKWIFGAYIGRNLPHSWLDTLYDPGLSLEGVIEDLFTPRFSVFAAAGYNKFTVDRELKDIVAPLKIYNFSGNLKFYPVIGTFQLAVFGGGSYYIINPGDDKFGINFGSSAEFRLTTSFSIEAKYNRHSIFTTGDNLTFSTFQGGIRIRF